MVEHTKKNSTVRGETTVNNRPLEPQDPAERLFRKTIALIYGLDKQSSTPLGDVRLAEDSRDPLYQAASEVFLRYIRDTSVARRKTDSVEACESENSSTSTAYSDHCSTDRLKRDLCQEAEKAKAVFLDYYSRPERSNLVKNALEALDDAKATDEEKALVVATVWAPEIAMQPEETLERWRLYDVEPNPAPIQPTEVTIQLNGLYTLPDSIPEHLPDELKHEASEILNNPGERVAQYDHPVPLFEHDDRHELVNCLEELDRELSFEKEMGVLPEDHLLIVTLSVSVTHSHLDRVCGRWIESLLRSKQYRHIRVLILTEHAVQSIKQEAGGEQFDLYSVFGPYGVHFNALKYTQLLLETAFAIRAGFKLDTDEGIRSQDLYRATGRTWFQTLCHPLWGGSAWDWHGATVQLAINEGEYINDTDIVRLGYTKALREPDVKIPSSFIGEDIFFKKSAAHGFATSLYNRCSSLEAHISHPVVKGGGYGITNKGLKEAVPFTYSRVGRAEDQQFYFTGLTAGIRGIFHPDLRIAHYKDAVAVSERKTASTRFIEDLYRLVLFEHLVDMMGIKEDIDPMPGVFAGKLARAQSFFQLVHKALWFYTRGEKKEAKTLLIDGLTAIQAIGSRIESGEVGREWVREREQWRQFVSWAEQTNGREMIAMFERFMV